MSEEEVLLQDVPEGIQRRAREPACMTYRKRHKVSFHITFTCSAP